MERKKVIVFNGPPNAGKDYACDYLKNNGLAEHFRFKDKLYELTYFIYNVDENYYLSLSWYEFMKLMTDRKLKSLPTKVFGGLTPRQALIHVSEDIIKPNFGKDYFGKILSHRILNFYYNPKTENKIAIVSDSGFYEELEMLTELFDVTLVRLYRDGCDFSNDSRGYIDPTRTKVKKFVEINNSGTLKDFELKLMTFPI